MPPDDPDSNYGLAERMLLSPLGAQAPRAIRMPADTPQLGQAALWYDDALATELDGGPLDLAILGVGEDGHICSLFPGHKALTGRTICARWRSRMRRSRRARRLSLTLRYVLQTKKIWVIAIGAAEAAGASGGDQQDEQLDAARSVDAAGEET